MRKVYTEIADIGRCRECGLPFVHVAEFLCRGDSVPRLAAFCAAMHQRQIERTQDHQKLINHDRVLSTGVEPGQARLFN